MSANLGDGAAAIPRRWGMARHRHATNKKILVLRPTRSGTLGWRLGSGTVGLLVGGETHLLRPWLNSATLARIGKALRVFIWITIGGVRRVMPVLHF
jgi:hypothetical protein